MDLKPFVLRTDLWKGQLFRRLWSRYAWCKASTAFHDKNILPRVKHGGGSMMMWACTAASGPEQLAIIDRTMSCALSLPKNPEGEYLVVDDKDDDADDAGHEDSPTGLYREKTICSVRAGPPLEWLRRNKIKLLELLRWHDRTLNRKLKLKSPPMWLN